MDENCLRFEKLYQKNMTKDINCVDGKFFSFFLQMMGYIFWGQKTQTRAENVLTGKFHLTK